MNGPPMPYDRSLSQAPQVRSTRFALGCLVTLLATAFIPPRASANELTASIVTHKTTGGQRTDNAEVLREFSDGSLVALTSDGQLLMLDNQQLVSSLPTDGPLQPSTHQEIIQQLQMELGSSFSFYPTKHYVIAYNTSLAYAQWVGQLFERLNRGFLNYWRTRRVDLAKPRFPLVAIVTADKPSYLVYAQRDIGDAAQSMIGYYNMNSNRMVMYDLTGTDGLVPAGANVSSQALINQLLSQPQAERTVATIVHEAVHQISFNSGLQVRLADNPLWLSEGLAMFFEAPDFQSPQGWKIGNINYHNFRLFQPYLTRRPPNALRALIQDDQRFKSAETVADAYPESWALTYFLLKARGKPLSAYLKDIGQLPPLGESSTDERLRLFQEHFGDIDKLDRDFIQFMRGVR
ncbi:MAG: DUF1570 domain-containing protein [Pirellulaceae bacterium]|nr:DUF1570 domain-containing protein [Pirellulaceae bacterium]